MKPAADRTAAFNIRQIERRDERRWHELFDAYTLLPKDVPRPQPVGSLAIGLRPAPHALFRTCRPEIRNRNWLWQTKVYDGRREANHSRTRTPEARHENQDHRRRRRHWRHRCGL